MFFNKIVKCFFFIIQNSSIIPNYIIFIKINYYTIFLLDKSQGHRNNGGTGGNRPHKINTVGAEPHDFMAYLYLHLDHNT